MEKNVSQINGRITRNVDASVKNIIYVKKIMFRILLHVIVKMKNIYQVLWMIQELSVMIISESFNCLSHELLIAKLHTYGFDKRSLVLIYNYLSNCKQRVKVNDSYSYWKEILLGVPQGSILGPLLFNIFICDMFYFMEDFEIANYADDSTPFSAKLNHKSVVEELEFHLEFYLHGFGATI